LSVVILNEIKPNDDKNDNIDGNNPAVIENTKRRSPSRKPCFCVPLLKNKYFLWPFILFLLTLGTLFIVLVERNNLIDDLKDKLRMKEETQNQNNQTVNEPNNLSSEKPTTIAQLNTTLPESDNKNNQTVKQTDSPSSTKSTTTASLNTTVKPNNNSSWTKSETTESLNTTVKPNNNSSWTKSTTTASLNTTVKPNNNSSSKKTKTTAPLKTKLKNGQANVLN
jgi:hypothetical protein